MTVETEFARWTTRNTPAEGWGLAWYLANEFCRRFYRSHGIAPQVIEHEGLGYYGISLDPISCGVNRDKTQTLGRMTVHGNVENWRSGTAGDHGLRLEDQLDAAGRPAPLVAQAIRWMDLPTLPSRSHLGCRHQRWGASYELAFEIATVIALRNDGDNMQIWNHPFHTDERIRALDARAGMRDHPGAFLFRINDRERIVTGDGRLLVGDGTDLWNLHMQGTDIGTLADLVVDDV